ncbi:hypothetical protein J2X31_002394 [Flavobacterium arsenatis]|uniref:Lipocalin-like domain-containing protein n=1 Tax=Flavobacterium arsenatis TaxID=1484332 RepID=A0ABU1TQY3_9FLAO|nr:lipocalin family protein [Flavobacterium arsenatis]MDR6968371.1 hypothetical protein [Flavobacterium arsenatis]
MKKIKTVLVAFVLAGLTLTSCGSDDNSGPATPATVVGKWTQTRTVTKLGTQAETSTPYEFNVAGCDKNYIEFATAGSLFKEQYFFKNGAQVCVEDTQATGTWSKTNETLTINSPESAYDEVYKIITLSNSQLVISFDTQAGPNTLVTTYYFTKI